MRCALGFWVCDEEGGRSDRVAELPPAGRAAAGVGRDAVGCLTGLEVDRDGEHGLGFDPEVQWVRNRERTVRNAYPFFPGEGDFLQSRGWIWCTPALPFTGKATVTAVMGRLVTPNALEIFSLICEASTDMWRVCRIVELTNTAPV